jgi:hypothetical protein
MGAKRTAEDPRAKGEKRTAENREAKSEERKAKSGPSPQSGLGEAGPK